MESSVSAESQASGPHLLALDDGSNRVLVLRIGSNVVGRGQDADFRIPDTSFERRHFDVQFDGIAATLSDLTRSGSVQVNGQQVSTCPLVDGDAIRVGQKSLIYKVTA